MESRTRIRSLVLALLPWVTVMFLAEIAGTPAPARPASGAQVNAKLIQVMRGILFPNANVIFAAQRQNPASVKPDADPTMSTNPLTGSFGGWEAVENSSFVLAETANLLTIPGRVCSNGQPVPVQKPDWAKFVQGLRDAGMAAYKAAQSKNQTAITEASDQVATACENCHEVYRDKTPAQGGNASRCLK
jgi:cytochrome c553